MMTPIVDISDWRDGSNASRENIERVFLRLNSFRVVNYSEQQAVILLTSEYFFQNISNQYFESFL